MKKLISSVLFVATTIATLCSCEKQTTTQNSDAFKPSVTGRNGEVLVVINDDIKSDTAGRYLASILTENVLGLSAPEPLFDMQTVPHGYFNDVMSTFRNIIDVVVNDTISTNTVACYNNMWAQPQAYISIRANNKKALLPLIESNHIKIVSFITKLERDRQIAYNKRVPHIALCEEIAKQWGVTLSIPNTFSRCSPKNKTDMSWVRIDTDESNINLLIYSLPYVDESSLTIPYLLSQRDSLLKANIEGPAGSYMCTETRFGLDEIVYNSGKYNGMDIAELRGLWRMEGYAMGGPFLLRAHHDTINNRIIVTDGFVYYPSKDKKRNLIRQLEAIMYTLTVNNNE